MRPIASLLAVVALLVSLGLPGTGRAGLTKLTRVLRHETTTLATLESLSDWIVRSEQDLDEARFRRKQLEAQIAEAARRRDAFEKRLTVHRRQVQLRLRALYKMSRGGLVRLLLEAPDEQQLSGRVSAASLILRRDIHEIDAFKDELQKLRAERASLEQARVAQSKLAEKLESRQAQLRAARDEQLAVLRRLQYSQKLQQALAGELDAHQRALLRRIGALRWMVRTAGGFAAQKGRLPRPVGGPVTSIFGQTVEGAPGLSVSRHGFTYRPSQREAVHVVADGLVRVAGPFEGYGRLVVVEHSDGYFSLYGFLASTLVTEGQRVHRTAPIGRAGIDPLTGHTATYFELRHGERPLDPAVWLNR